MLSDSQRLNPSSLLCAFRPGPAAVLLAAAVVGIALQLAIIVMGPTTLATIRLPWLAAFLVLLAGASFWWGLYLWLLNRLGGVGPREGLNRSVALSALLSLSLIPDVAIFLAGRLPFALIFDGYLRSLYVWMVGSLVFVVFVGQELVLAGAARGKSPFGLAIEGFRYLPTLPRWISRLPGSTVLQVRRHPWLVAILAAGIVQRWVGINDYHVSDMNDTLSVVYTLLSWPPFRYFHDYSPQTYIYAHLPLFQILIAPFYWFFENVAKLPTPWAAMLVSAVADLVSAVLIYTQAKGRWKGLLGLILAAVWLLSPLVAGSDDHAVCVAAAFTIAAFATRERGWLCGIMIALAAAARTEALFLALPLILHYATRRGLRETVAFLGAFTTTLGAIALPFVLTDPEAIDFAMRLQGHRQASGEVSYLLFLMLPHLGAGLASTFEHNPSLLATVVTLLASLLALRDGRVTRVALVVALAYALTIPVMHTRYMVFFYGVGLYYAACYGNPLVAIATVMASWSGIVENVEPWPGPLWAWAAQLSLALVLAVFGTLRFDRRKIAEDRGVSAPK